MSEGCWRPLGPAAVLIDRKGAVAAGEFLTVALDRDDPDGRTVYAGAAGGGLWKTTDEGISWKPIGDGLPNATVGALALGPAPEGTALLVGTGSTGTRSTGVFFSLPGNGVALSTNDGLSWQHLLDFVQGTDLQHAMIRGAAIDLLGAREIWVATEWVGLLWKTRDEPQWQRAVTDQGQRLSDRWTSVVITGDRVLAGYGGGGTALARDGLYTAPLDGSNPRIMARITGSPDPLPAMGTISEIALAVAPSNPSIVYAAFIELSGRFSLFRSSDGGTTWNRREAVDGFVSLVTTQAATLLVHPGDPNRIYLNTGTVFASFDGGATVAGWHRVDLPRGQPRAIAFSHVAPFNAWLASSTALYRSTSEGTRMPSAGSHTDWQLRSRGLGTVRLNGLAQHPAERSILLGASPDRGLLRYRNHPLWERTDEMDTFRVGIDPNDPRVWYATTDFSAGGKVRAVKQSVDGGKTWRTISDGLDPDDANELPPLVIDSSKKGIVYFGTVKLWRWDNSRPDQGWVRIAEPFKERIPPGGTEKELVVSPITAIVVAPSDSNVVYLGTKAGDVFRVVFNTQTAAWDVSGPLVPSTTGGFRDGISSIAVSFQDPQLVYVTLGLPALPLRNGERFKVEKRLWRSANGGNAWEAISLPFPDEDAYLHKVLLHPDDGRFVVASDRGVHIGRDDGVFGTHWTDLGANLPRTPVADLLLFPPGPTPGGASGPLARTLRAATFGRGAWERALDEPATAAECAFQDDVRVRDDLLDTGRESTPATRPDPLDPEKTLSADDGIDLKIDRPDQYDSFATPKGNRDYLDSEDADAVADFIGFELLRKRRQVRIDVETHVYLQVHNRGPASTNARARVLYAQDGVGGAPPLPINPFTDIAATEPWQPVGAVQAFELRAADPAVLRWTGWRPPSSLKGKVLLVGFARSDVDLADFAGGQATTAALADKRVAFRLAEVVVPKRGFFRPWMLLVVLGLAGGIAAAVWGDDVYRFLRDKLGRDSEEPGAGG